MVLEQKEINVENASMINVMVSARACLTSFPGWDAGDSIGHSDRHMPRGSVYLMGECHLQ